MLGRAGLPRRRLRPARCVDPFSALSVQLALSRIEAELRALEAIGTSSEPERFAQAHHLYAARLAYDQLLDEACRMAGVADLPAERGSIRRLTAEVELRLRGWTW